MESSKPIPARRIPLTVTSRLYQVDRKKFPNSTLTEAQINDYKTLVVNNPARAYREFPPELYHVWTIAALRGVPVRYDNVGVDDEDAGEKDGYKESYGRGPISYNKPKDFKKREDEKALLQDKRYKKDEEWKKQILEEAHQKKEESEKRAADERTIRERELLIQQKREELREMNRELAEHDKSVQENLRKGKLAYAGIEL